MSNLFPIEHVLEALERGRHLVDLSGVDVDLAAYLAVALHEQLRRPFVVVTPDVPDARRVADDLAFFGGPEVVGTLPLVEASPYDDLSPDRNAVMELLAMQARLAWDTAPEMLVTPVSALARKAVPSDVLLERSHIIAAGQDLDRAQCLRAFADAGYHAVSAVEDPGTFAIRGHILDVYPPHLDRPARVELWGDEVESIRPFNPETQRANRDESIEEIVVPPVREELLISPHRERARQGMLEAAAHSGFPSRKLQPLLDDLANGIPFMGIEGFRPAFYDGGLVSMFDFLPKRAVFLLVDPMGCGERLRGDWESRVGEYEGALTEPRPVLPPHEHVLEPREVIEALERRDTLRAHVLQLIEEMGQFEGPQDAVKFTVPGNGDLSVALDTARGDREPLRPLAEAVRGWAEDGARVVLACHQQTQLDRLERVLKSYNVPVQRGDRPPRDYLRPPDGRSSGAVLVQGDVSGGFRLLDHGFALVTEDEIFGRKAPRRAKARHHSDDSPFLQSFRELEPGDYVVHTDHGIGKYLGLKKLILGGMEADFLEVEFAGADKLFLPVHKLGRVQKYVGPDAAKPKVDKLGGTRWEKVRAKAAKTAEEDAYALLELYAQREMAQGYGFSQPDEYFRTFESTFPFQETPDQARAIDEVLADMVRPRPMDRLLCGDVGFGKTEVSVRATMKAVLDAKQVAILVPTTVLALQHFKTFQDRFAKYPVRVELLSRLVTNERQREILKDVKAGKVDIVVGTHRLLGKDIKFKDLGLLVIDEEHRFGVKHKERLKSLRTEVDILTMTATPIPRTLQLGITGLRDLSVITTPPTDRLSVRTFVCRATDQVVRDAILRELGRGGQVFFVHNRVHSIETRKAWLQSLVPEARIAVGHGQMAPDKLEKVMLDFIAGRFNVLLATTIIESGLDIPNANTMLIDHADQLGLAQLYQLRGRVGRSRERGYCYLLVPGEAALAGDARKRLGVIQKFTELGSGFQVASHDLEIRGAGELLGTRQTGQIAAVGLDLYAQLLDEAVRKLKGEAPKVEFDPDINLQVSARIPEDYVPDNHLRLVFYKRLANADDEEDVLSAVDEMEDRFGPLPGPVENLVEVMRIRTLARWIGLSKVDHPGGEVAVFTFHKESPFPASAVIQLIHNDGSRFRAPADFKLSYHLTREERHDPVQSVRVVLQRLAEFVTDAQEAEA